MLIKIALQGLKGRKKDTLLFFSVILLTLIFMVSVVSVHTSAQYSKKIERERNYGLWQVGAFELEDQEMDAFISQNKTAFSQMGISDLLGSSTNAGLVGSMEGDLEDLGNFQLLEGRMPLQPREIALEANQMAKLPKDIKLGDTFIMTLEIPLVRNDLNTLKKQATRESFDRALEMAKAIKADLNSKEAQDLIKSGRRMSPNFLQTSTLEELQLFIYRNIAKSTVRFDKVSDQRADISYAIETSYLLTEEMEKQVDSQDPTKSPLNNIDLMRQYGKVADKTLIISTPMTLVGILETYNDRWDLGTNRMPNAFVVADFIGDVKSGLIGPEAVALLPKTDFTFYKTLLFTQNKPLTLPDQSKYHINKLGTEDAKLDQDQPLVMAVIALAFVVSVASVFQVYLAQLKRRTRRLTLMRSIGATTEQVVGLIAIETGVIMLLCLPLGLGLGLAIARGALVWFSNQSNMLLQWHIEGGALALVLILNVLAVVLGMLIPIFSAIGAPLTGEMQGRARPKGPIKPHTHVKLDQDYPYTLKHRLTFFRISLKHALYQRHRHLISIGMYSFALACLLLAGTIAYWALLPYQNSVVEAQKPNYTMAFAYGFSQGDAKDLIDEIEAIEGVSKAQVVKGTEEVFVWYPALAKHPIFSTFKGALDAKATWDHFGQGRDFDNIELEDRYALDEAIATCAYGLDPESDLLQRLIANSDAGSFDSEAFSRGDQVIVLLPKYKPTLPEQGTIADAKGNASATTDNASATTDNASATTDNASATTDNASTTNDGTSSLGFRKMLASVLEKVGAYRLSYNAADQLGYMADFGIGVGQSLTLSAKVWPEPGVPTSEDIAVQRIATVGLIVNDFERLGLWPVTTDLDAPVVITSYEGLRLLHPGTWYTPRYLSTRDLFTYNDYAPSYSGKTWFNVYTESEVNRPALLTSINRLANEHVGRVLNYERDNRATFQSGFKVAAIVMVLGVTIATVSLLILYNMTLTKVENERERSEILRCLGVTQGQFELQYLTIGFLYGLLALALSHAIWLALVGFMAASKGLNIIGYFDLVFWQYPWRIHLGVNVAFFLLTVSSYYLPIKRRGNM